MCAGPPAPKKAENISKSTADRCLAVLPEQIFCSGKAKLEENTAVLSRALTQHGRKSARQNRYAFDSRQLMHKNMPKMQPALLPFKYEKCEINI